MRAVSVMIDRVLVAEDRHTERIHIAGVPTGVREVTVVASEDGRSAVDRTERVSVASGEETTILIARPPRSIGYWINSAVLVLVYGVLLLTSDID